MEEPHLIRRVSARAPDPRSIENHLVGDKEAGLGRGAFDQLRHLAHQFGCEPFVRVEVKHPVVLQRDVVDRPVALRAERLERIHEHVRTRFARDSDRPIRRSRIEHVYIVRPRAALDRAADVALFIERQNHHRHRRAQALIPLLNLVELPVQSAAPDCARAAGAAACTQAPVTGFPRRVVGFQGVMRPLPDIGSTPTPILTIIAEGGGVRAPTIRTPTIGAFPHAL